jgi:hypothetical protein
MIFLPFALSLSSTFTKIGAVAAFAALVGIAVLSLLVFSQARELKRLREWAGRAPERAADLEQRVTAAAAVRVQHQGPAVQSVRPVPQAAPVQARVAAGGAGLATRVVAAPAAPAVGAPAGQAPPTPGASPAPTPGIAAGAPSHTAFPPAVSTQSGVPISPPLPGQTAAPVAPGARTPAGTPVPAAAAPASPVAPGATPVVPAAGAPASVAGAAQSPPAVAGSPPAAVGEPSRPAPATAAAAAAANPRAPVPPRADAPAPAQPDDRAVTAAARRPPAPSVAPGSTTARTVRQEAHAPIAAARAPISQRPRSTYTAKRSPRGRTLALVGGLIVVAAAVAVVVASLGGSTSPNAASTSASTTTRHSTSSSPRRSHKASPQPAAKTPAVSPAETNVAVLNATETEGLARRTASELQQNGYSQAIALNGHPPGSGQVSIVEYTSGHQAEAEAVARSASVTRVQPIEAAVGALTGSASVVLIVGADKTASG